MMVFRLTYEGRLLSNGNTKHKQEIRRVLHPQLKQWGKVAEWEGGFLDLNSPVGPFNFRSIVTSRLYLVAELDILFLRRQEPGALVSTGGDIDNRMKTLLDALRMPQKVAELPAGDAPGSDEDPFWCLLENDNLITRLNVDTDRLLVAGEPDSVRLIIKVEIKPTYVPWTTFIR